MDISVEVTPIKEATTRNLSVTDTGDLTLGYQRTEVGLIPDDWRVKGLGQLGRFKNGINKSKEDFGHGYPFVNLMDVFGVPKVSSATSSFGLVNSTSAERKLYDLRGGDVLFVRSSVKPEGVGLTTLIPESLPETVFSGFLIRYRDNGELDPAFREHCFWEENFRKRVMAASTVSANTNINQNALKELLVGFPARLCEQRAIAEALSDVDELLGALEALIAKKRAIKQGAMQQLLTGKTRLPGFRVAWEPKRLGDHLTFLRHGVNPRAELSSDGSVYYLHYGDIHTTINVFLDHQSNPLPTLSKSRAKNLDRLQDGDLVLVDASEDLEGVGKSVEIKGVLGQEIVSGLHTIAVRFDKAVLADGYKAYLQFCPIFRQHLRRLAAGTKVYATNRSHIASVEMPLPSTDEQIAIAAVLSDMDAEITALEARRDKTRAIKQGMMQQLLTGRIRLVKPQPAEVDA